MAVREREWARARNRERERGRYDGFNWFLAGAVGFAAVFTGAVVTSARYDQIVDQHEAAARPAVSAVGGGPGAISATPSASPAIGR